MCEAVDYTTNINLIVHSVRHIFQRGRKRGSREGGCPPPLFEKGGIAPHSFARDDNFLSSAMPLHT